MLLYAGNFMQADQYLRANGIPPFTMRKVSEPHHLIGCFGGQMIVTGTARNQRWYPRMMEMARMQGIEVIDRTSPVMGDWEAAEITEDQWTRLLGGTVGRIEGVDVEEILP